MMATKDSARIRSFSFITEHCPRLSINDSDADEMIAKQKPVILTDTNLVSSALHWSPAYLRDNIGDAKMNVFIAKDSNFKYFDSKKNISNVKVANKQTTMTFAEFYDKIRNHEPDQPRLYLQQQLTEGVGERIAQDYLRFNWPWLVSQKQRLKWGAMTSNLLLVGMEGNVTPAHFDEQENFFTQLQGWKRCLMFSPDQFECLYPYPVHHPHDRQSQVDLYNPDLTRFPKFNQAHAIEAIVKPGDVLYIPVYWWHHIESLYGHGTTVSVNFWFKGESLTSKEIVYPLTSVHRISMMRNMEKMLGEAIGDPRELGPFLRAMVDGRYSDT